MGEANHDLVGGNFRNIFLIELFEFYGLLPLYNAVYNVTQGWQTQLEETFDSLKRSLVPM